MDKVEGEVKMRSGIATMKGELVQEVRDTFLKTVLVIVMTKIM